MFKCYIVYKFVNFFFLSTKFVWIQKSERFFEASENFKIEKDQNTNPGQITKERMIKYDNSIQITDLTPNLCCVHKIVYVLHAEQEVLLE